MVLIYSKDAIGCPSQSSETKSQNQSTRVKLNILNTSGGIKIMTTSQPVSKNQ